MKYFQISGNKNNQSQSQKANSSQIDELCIDEKMLNENFVTLDSIYFINHKTLAFLNSARTKLCSIRSGKIYPFKGTEVSLLDVLVGDKNYDVNPYALQAMRNNLDMKPMIGYQNTTNKYTFIEHTTKHQPFILQTLANFQDFIDSNNAYHQF